MIGAVFAVTVILAFFALGTDVGLRRLVDCEVQDAADASAIAGGQVLMLSTPTTVDESAIDAAAIAATMSNPTTRGVLTMNSGDVQVGIWDPDARTFTASAADVANAVRTTVVRSTARGNGIPTVTPGNGGGVQEMSTTRSAIARVEVPPDYPLVGLDGFSSKGILSVTSWPTAGKANIASNGDVKLNLLGLIGVTWIDGHVATLGNVQCPLIGVLTKIKDGIRRPEKAFVLPSVSLQSVQTRNDNDQLGSLLSGSGDLNILLAADLPAGTYCVNNLNVLAGAVLKAKGPVTIYVRNDVTILGTVLAWSSEPANFKLRVAGSGAVTIAANLTLSADIYAPQAAITIAAGVSYSGRLIGERIDVLGTSFFTLRPDLPPPELGRPRVTLVR